MECDGITGTVAQSVTHTGDLAVTVEPDSLQVTTTAGNALTIEGAGAVSFIDTFAASSLTASGAGGIAALSITSTGGSVTVSTDGEIIGRIVGIDASNGAGDGALSITANGNVTSSSGYGIRAENEGSDLTVITGATVSGAVYGIVARNYGSGATVVTTNGNVAASAVDGILAQNGTNVAAAGTNLTVTTGATVTGANNGINAQNFGRGATTVMAYGNVTGTTTDGIYARNEGTSLTVTTGPDTMVMGDQNGINARNYGSGGLTIAANGNVTATNVNGIEARNGTSAAPTGTNVAVTTGVDTTVTGAVGINVHNYGSEGVTVEANGNVIGTGFDGIFARNDGTYLTVTTGADTIVSGENRGIDARNYGSRGLAVTARGDVTGTNEYGIFALNSAAGTNLNVATGASTDGVTGGNYGIYARNEGSGSVTVTANGSVEGTNVDGIFALNGTGRAPSGTSVTVTTAADTTVLGGANGINARNYGDAALTIEANGNVTGTADDGIYARNSASATGDITVTTGPSLLGVVGGTNGINAQNYGSGALSVAANGDVEGGSADGISAQNGTDATPAGTNVTVTTGASTSVTGSANGINAQNFGSGDTTVTANGNVTGTSNYGIVARNGYRVGGTVTYAGDDLTVTTGATTEVTGGAQAILTENYGTGNTTINVNGNVTGGVTDFAMEIKGASSSQGMTVTTAAGTDVEGGFGGIYANHRGAGPVTVNAYGDVTGGTTSIGRAISAYSAMAGTALTIRTGGFVESVGGYGIGATSFGSANVAVGGNIEAAEEGIKATVRAGGTDLTVTTDAGTSVTAGGENGIYAQNLGNGALSITANGNVTSAGNSGDDAAIKAENTGTSLTVTTGADSNITSDRIGIRSRNFGTGELTVNANGYVTAQFSGIFADQNNGNGELIVITGADSEIISNSQNGIRATSGNTGAVRITVAGKVSSNTLSGIFADHENSGGEIFVTSETGSTITSQPRLAIETTGGRTSLIVAGTLNGGAAGAVEFDQGRAFDDRLELRPTGTINGTVLAGLGTDTLAFGGSGEGTFDLTNIDTGADTQQYRSFEDFEVESGTWTFAGATTAPFTVNGGTLMGTGTFGGLTVNGGTVAPGNSIGTLIVNGAFTMNAGSVLEVEVNAAGQNDKVIVNGTVNLTGATLRVLAANGDYNPSTDYTIIENDGADAVVGQFATVTSSLAFLVPTVFYSGGDGNDVVLNLERNETLFPDVARTPNQRAVAGALAQFPMTNALFLAVLNQTAEGARTAFDALSGEIHATVAGTLADDSRYVREAILGRLMQAGHTSADGQVAALGAAGTQVATLNGQAMALSSPQGDGGKSLSPTPSREALAFWTRGFGAWGDFDGDGNAASADRNLGGFVSGMDASIGGSWRAGLATGASFSNVDVDDRYSSADVESYHLGGYLGGVAGAFALRGGGMWAWNEIDTSRAVIFPGFFERQKASYDADTGQIFGEVAYPTQMGGIAVEPFGGLAYVSVDTDSFRERGGALASLRGVDTDQDVGYSTLGLRAATTMYWGAMLVTPHISAAWQHAFDDVTPGASLAFASTGIGFGIDGVPLAEDSALIGAGLDFSLGPNASAGVSYSGQFADNVTDNAVKGRFTWLF